MPPGKIRDPEELSDKKRPESIKLCRRGNRDIICKTMGEKLANCQNRSCRNRVVTSLSGKYLLKFYKNANGMIFLPLEILNLQTHRRKLCREK